MELNRMLWASRRGMLELDLFLIPFAENVLPKLSDKQLELYALLMESEDQDLFHWLMDRGDPQDVSLLPMVELIRQFNADGSAP